MELQIVQSRPEYAPPALLPPPPSGYLHLAASVAPPVGPPLVRPSARRAALIARLEPLAADLAGSEAVRRVTLYRAVLMPPLGRGSRHPARFDVVVLVETTSPDVLGEVSAAPEFRRMRAEASSAARDEHLMFARCARSLGDVDRSRPGLFLFNYFAADDPAAALRLWEHLAGWYVKETGLDNSTLLAPIGEADYVLVNHARWDKSLLRLAVEQFTKPSFHSYVRANLRRNHVTAMPALYRVV